MIRTTIRFFSGLIRRNESTRASIGRPERLQRMIDTTVQQKKNKPLGRSDPQGFFRVDPLFRSSVIEESGGQACNKSHRGADQRPGSGADDREKRSGCTAEPGADGGSLLGA